MVLAFPQEATSFMDSYDYEQQESKGVNKIKSESYHKHYHPQEKSGICVVRRKGESDDDLLKRFRKKFSKSGLAKEYRDRMYYEKPSDKRRRKKMQSIRLMEREAEKEEEMQKKFEKFKAKKQRLQTKKQRKEMKHDTSRSRQDRRSTNESHQDKRRFSSS